ncbi:hypothetical protein Tco_0657460 [Tanacetum coccineum]|uniref:Uncharacterized protein n=1 Tax=Tanacetum coccineum TaxID=301880 RepID=A0ABQ4XBU8_9ASTR
MVALKFASSHSMVAFLDKPTESDGFEQIVDFLNAHPIKYALTVNPTIYTSCIEQFLTTTKVKTVNGELQIQVLVDTKKVIITKTSIRSDLQLEQLKIFEQLTLIGAKTIASNAFSSTMASAIILFLDKQVEGMSKHKKIYVTPSHTKKIFANMKREGKGFSGTITPLFPTMIVQAQKQVEPVTDDTENVASVPTHSNDPLLSGEDRLKLNELMELCTSLSQRVLDLEKTKTSQAAEITELKKRVKRLEKKGWSRTHRLKRLYKVGRSARVVSSKDEGLGDQEDASKQGRKIDEIDQDAEVTLVDETQGRYGDNLMFDTGVLDNEQDMAEKEVDMAEKDVSTADPVTTVGEVVTTANVVVSTAEVTTDNTTTTNVDELTLAQTLIEIKATKPKARRAKTVKPEKPLKKKDQIMFDKEVAQKLQAQLDVELEEEEKKLARQREEDANIPECILQDLEQKIREENKITKETEGSSKRAGEELESENLKKQKLDENVEVKVDDDQEEAEMKKYMEIVSDDEVAIDAIPLATKPPIIVDWKIIKEGKMGYFQIIRADGSSKRYSSMIKMLQNIDREDLETLWKLVKAKHGLTRPEEAYERVLWGDLKVMFEPDVESEVWRNLQGHKVTVWKLFSSSGVHFVRFQNLHIFMLVEKRYPLTPATITEMLNKKLQADHWNEMCYQLLKLMTKQLKNPGSV